MTENGPNHLAKRINQAALLVRLGPVAATMAGPLNVFVTGTGCNRFVFVVFD
jgi:hypothetical protein